MTLRKTLTATVAHGLIAVILATANANAQATVDQPAATPPAATPAQSEPTPAQELVPSGQPSFALPRVGDTASQVKLIAGLCAIQMKDMSPMACNCLAEQALTGLRDPDRDYLIAAVVAPPVADRMLKDGRVTQTDQKAIFDFLNTTSQACTSGTFKPAPAIPAN